MKFDATKPQEGRFRQTFRQYLDIILEEPNADTYLIWGVSDKWSWLGGLNRQKGLIYDDNLKPKPAYDSVMASINAHPASEVKTPYPASVLNPPKDCGTGNCDDPIAIKTLAKLNNISIHLAGRALFVTGLASKTCRVTSYSAQRMLKATLSFFQFPKDYTLFKSVKA